jgi:hypothetical protein
LVSKRLKIMKVKRFDFAEKKPQPPDEEILAALIVVRTATVKAAASLEKGLSDAEQVLADLRRKA